MLGQVTFHELGVELSSCEVGIMHDPLVERDAGLDSFDDEHFKRPFHFADGFRARISLHDEFGDQFLPFESRGNMYIINIKKTF